MEQIQTEKAEHLWMEGGMQIKFAPLSLRSVNRARVNGRFMEERKEKEEGGYLSRQPRRFACTLPSFLSRERERESKGGRFMSVNMRRTNSGGTTSSGMEGGSCDSFLLANLK